MFGSSFKIATVWGIPIRIHSSLLFLLVFLGILSVRYMGWGAVLPVFTLQLGVFASIALHELGHSFVALRKGCRVREIVLMFIGGVAQMERIPERPKDEFLMAVAGPLVSLVLGALLLALGTFFPSWSPRWRIVIDGAGELNLLQSLGSANISLLLFNLIPAFPMDGGRMLRALLARRKGRLGATRIAARIGKFVAVAFVLYGIHLMRVNWWSGMMLLLVAFFVYSNAGREYRHVLRQHQMRSGGWGGWPFGFGGGGEPPPPEDVVTISPPPYERGPHREAEIRTDRGG